ncbi:Exopolysaccharide production protein ExoY [Chlamydiales bacterium SCGC AG-110-P3]|nr:Exopolysaccharide production protein ExoY [Chlamydiales bacterium SCGC AG-110-P3]
MVPRYAAAYLLAPTARTMQVDAKRTSSVPFGGKIRHLPGKRLFDIIFSATTLLALSPLFLLLAIIVKVTSRGPTFYGHERVGRGGRKFHCYKFRTMHRDADQRLVNLLASDKTLAAEWKASHKLKHDPRVTSVGKFLRQTSLDELPQFWNVLRGDLSVVGPRPVVETEMVRFLGERSSKILSIRPGLTCVWQVSGRSNTSYDTRVAMDLDYVHNHSLGMDLKLIAKTIPAMISSHGAY